MVLLFLFVVSSITIVTAEVQIYPFNDSKQEQRFQRMIQEYRCPKCQNQSIADSNAPLSNDLKYKIYEMIKEGRSDQEINTYLVARYGDFISYRPPVRKSTIWLWLIPGAALLIGVVVIILQVKKSQANLSHQVRDLND